MPDAARQWPHGRELHGWRRRTGVVPRLGASDLDVVVATKVSDLPANAGLRAANIAAAVEQSLRRLQTDYIDVHYAHYDDPDTPLEESIGAFDALVERGVVRYIGLSNYRAERAQAWIDVAIRTRATLPVSIHAEVY